MRELATYSIETDHVVLLAFRDGIRRRVGIRNLEKYLTPTDLAQVEASLKLRHHFIKSHMPKIALTLAVGGLVSLMAVVGRPLASLWMPQAAPAQTSPGSTAIVRNVAAPTATPTPATPLPAASPPATVQPVASPQPKVAVRRQTKSVTAVTVSAKSVVSPVTSSLTVGLPAPSPTPLPTGPVTSPNLGEVLGDSTGPGNPTTTPSPTPSPSATPSLSPSPSATPKP